MPPREAISFASICRAKPDPRLQNPAMGFFWGVDQDLIAGAKFFFGDVETKNPGNSSSDGRAHYRNRLGVVELVEKEPLMFATVENGEPFFLPKYKKTPKF